MGEIKSYRDLVVWQKSVKIVTEIYELLKEMPQEETFGLTSQIKRSSISIPSNIAEGFGREHTKDFIRFLQISRGSLFELQTQLEICANLSYLKHEEWEDIFVKLMEIEKMINSLIKKLKSNI